MSSSLDPSKFFSSRRLAIVLDDAAQCGIPASEVIKDPSELLGRSVAPGVCSTRFILFYCIYYIMHYRGEDSSEKHAKIVSFFDQALYLAQVTAAGAECEVPIVGERSFLSLTSGGILEGFGRIFEIAPALQPIWEQRAKIKQSSTTSPHIMDVLLFCGLFVCRARISRNTFKEVFHPIFRGLLIFISTQLEKGIWSHHCDHGSTPLAPLMGLSGKKRRRVDVDTLVDASKRIRRAGHTNEGPVSKATDDACGHRLASAQPKVRTCLMLEKGDVMYSGQRHFSFAWDPGLHSCQSTVGLVGYCPDIDLASYGPATAINGVPLTNYNSEDVLDYVESGMKLERRSSLAEICTVEHVLNAGFGGCSMTDCEPWDKDCLRPLRAEEVRSQIPGENGFMIEKEDGSILEETPAHFVDDQPTQVHCTDQGSVGAAGMFFLIFSLGYFMQVFPDPNHRVWNDIKLAAQRCNCFLWRTIVQLTHVFNLNYGPFGKGHHFDEKKRFWEDWKASIDIDDPFFRKHAPAIAKEIGLPEPSSTADFECLLAQVKEIKCCDNKGPLVKLMRWFSWWQSARWYEGELSVLKMVIEAYLAQQMDFHEADLMLVSTATGNGDPGAIDHPVNPDELAAQPDNPADQTAKAAKAELNEIKRKQGNWKAAFHCITELNLAQMRILLVAVRPIWNANTQRVKGVKNAQQSLAYEIRMSKGAWQDEIVAILSVLEDEVELGKAGAVSDIFDDDAQANRDKLQELRVFCFLISLFKP